MSVEAGALSAALAELDAVGVSERGVQRLAWTEEDSACREWFERQAQRSGLHVERDPAGNLWACPPAEPPWWGVGSHLDSVRGGGRFDGPLGVVAGFAVAAQAPVPVAVVSFADEEGARFNTPTFGSKALAGRLELPGVLERRDEDGVALGEAMRAAGIDPAGIAGAPGWLSRLRGFVEIHIDQSTDVARAGLALGVVSALASRRRLEVQLLGRADHAGTTPREERRDALGAAARLIVAADELGVRAGGVTVTTARIHVEPNAATTIADHVRLWVDGRSAEAARLDGWVSGLEGAAAELAQSTRVRITLHTASRSDGRAFDEQLRTRLRASGRRALHREIPEVVCFAGHDAGMIAEHLPAAMVLVRNPTGVSHSPAESVSMHDAATAAEIVLDTLREWA